ncbi:hypothetical protein [Aliiroseovarius sp. xm-g-7]|uniref:hypothetical protein n=1 Tax=Aliiroseovarius sp. xm-g-7 TaxID=2651826 RepID=UPI001569BE94|nr:hypothetical protein [Aliiroseovarius sp. xm-g-7]NRQ27748.1 hypothetical protein [Aliiroseovarius sp. xm-g-7]
MDIIAATQNFGTNEVYTKGPQEYEAQTVENMRADVLKRAKQTLKALKAYEGGKLAAPMARSGRNCIKVKIGYGKRNAALFDYGTDAKENPITELRHNADTASERRKAAIATVKQAIASIKMGGLDSYLEAYLTSRQTRSAAGADAARNPLAIAAE